MVKSVFMAVVAVACVLLGMVLMVGFASCSHASDGFIGDNPDILYFDSNGEASWAASFPVSWRIAF